jgi:hypothetical protein
MRSFGIDMGIGIVRGGEFSVAAFLIPPYELGAELSRSAHRLINSARMAFKLIWFAPVIDVFDLLSESFVDRVIRG